MPYKTDLSKALKKLDTANSAYLLISPDRVRTDLLRSKLLHHLDAKKYPTSLFFGEVLQPKDITSLALELSSSGLFSEKQIYRMVRADEMKAATLDAFLKNIAIDSASSNLLLLEASQLKANSRLRKHFQKKHSLLELKPIAAKELPAWTISHASALKIKISGSVAELLCDIGENSADKIDQALRHLKVYCDPETSPTKKEILELFHHHPDPNEFELLEQILTKPPHLAERAVLELLEGGKNAFLLLNLLGRSVSRLLHIYSLLEVQTPQKQIPGKIGASPWLFEKDLQILRKTSKPKVKRLHEAIIVADSQLKGRSLGDENIFFRVIHAS